MLYNIFMPNSVDSHNSSLRRAALLGITSLSLLQMPVKAVEERTLASEPPKDSFPALVVPKTSDFLDLGKPLEFSTKPIVIENHYHYHTNDTSKVEDSNKSYMSKVKDFLIDKAGDYLVPALALCAVAYFAFSRKFSSRLHVDITTLGKTKNSNQPGGVKNIFVTETLETVRLQDVYHIDLLAFIKFHVAVIQAQNRQHLPIMFFSNEQKFSNILGGHSANDVVGRTIRSHVSASNREGQLINHTELSEQRLKGDPNARMEYSPVLLVFTYEKLHVFQPRLYAIPIADTLDVLNNLKDYWSAAKVGGDGPQRRMVRMAEIASCMLLRYPTAYREMYGDSPELKSAKLVAKKLRKLLTLNPDPSVEFLDKYVNGKLHKSDLKVDRKEWHEKVLKVWYGTKDPLKQAQLLRKERSLKEVTDYLKICDEDRVPMWFTRLWVPVSPK